MQEARVEVPSVTREKSDATISRKNWMEKARANSKSYTLLMNAIF